MALSNPARTALVRTVTAHIANREPVDLATHPQVVTRQQLRNREFFDQVRERVLAGEVLVADGKWDKVLVGEQAHPLSSEVGQAALLHSQAAWLDQGQAQP